MTRGLRNALRKAQVSKSRIELLGEAIDRRNAGLARAEATAHARVDVRQLLNG